MPVLLGDSMMNEQHYGAARSADEGRMPLRSKLVLAARHQ